MSKYSETIQEFAIVDEPIESFTKIKFYGTYLPKIPKNTSLITTFNSKNLKMIHQNDGLYKIELKYIYVKNIYNVDPDQELNLNIFLDTFLCQGSNFKINYMIIVKDISKLRDYEHRLRLFGHNCFEYRLLNGEILKIIYNFFEYICYIGSQQITSKISIKNDICIPYFRKVQTKGAHKRSID